MTMERERPMSIARDDVTPLRGTSARDVTVEVANTSRVGTTEPSLGELFSRLGTDTSEMVRAEIRLARAEVTRMSTTVAKDAAKVSVGVGLGLMGALATTAFLVILAGDLLNNYWLGALLVGVVLLGVGALLARNAVQDIKRRGLKPQQTIATLQENAAWARRELADVKHELTR